MLIFPIYDLMNLRPKLRARLSLFLKQSPNINLLSLPKLNIIELIQVKFKDNFSLPIYKMDLFLNLQHYSYHLNVHLLLNQTAIPYETRKIHPMDYEDQLLYHNGRDDIYGQIPIQ